MSGGGGVALITSPRHESLWADRETPATIAALATRGVPAVSAGWYEDHDWAAFDLLVVRSPGPYWTPAEFVAWLHATSVHTTILNAPRVIEWCLDKHYLGQIAAVGVPTIPTIFVEPGDPLPPLPAREFVVKPVISGGSIDTARHAPGDIDGTAAQIAAIHARGMAAMVQPYIASVDARGERALVYIDGTYDHAITKAAVLRPGEAFDAAKSSHPNPRPCEPSAAERACADAALAAVPPGDVLYARVDMVDGDDGAPLVIELELVDPVMFHELFDGSYDRFAAAIERHWRRARSPQSD